MTAYLIAEIDVSDPAVYERYKNLAAETFAQHGGRYVVRGGHAVSLEGEAPKRIVVVEFDSVEAAQQWHKSAEYQAARWLRELASTGRLYVVEGMG
jgi:uncharacterized protein (DUF1330 family)